MPLLALSVKVSSTFVPVTPASGHGPDVSEKADADPREFLLEIDAPLP